MVNDTIIPDAYLAMTGQDPVDVMAGATQVGMKYLLETLIPRAIKEKKKLVWHAIDIKSGRGEYLFDKL